MHAAPQNPYRSPEAEPETTGPGYSRARLTVAVVLLTAAGVFLADLTSGGGVILRVGALLGFLAMAAVIVSQETAPKRELRTSPDKPLE